MNQDNWMAIKAYLPAVLLLGLSLMLVTLADRIDQESMVGQLGRLLGFGSLGALLAALVLFAHVTIRLWRADRGLGLLCNCSGLLGREIDGRYGPYRRCMRCTRNVPRREYEMLE